MLSNRRPKVKLFLPPERNAEGNNKAAGDASAFFDNEIWVVPAP